MSTYARIVNEYEEKIIELEDEITEQARELTDSYTALEILDQEHSLVQERANAWFEVAKDLVRKSSQGSQAVPWSAVKRHLEDVRQLRAIADHESERAETLTKTAVVWQNRAQVAEAELAAAAPLRSRISDLEEELALVSEQRDNCAETADGWKEASNYWLRRTGESNMRCKELTTEINELKAALRTLGG